MPSQPLPLPKTFSPHTSEKSQGDETWSWCHRSDVAMPCSAKRSLAAIEGRGPELMTWETNAGPDSHHQWVNCARLGVSIHPHHPLIGPRHRNPPPEQWPPLKLGHHSNKISWGLSSLGRVASWKELGTWKLEADIKATFRNTSPHTPPIKRGSNVKVGISDASPSRPSRSNLFRSSNTFLPPDLHLYSCQDGKNVQFEYSKRRFNRRIKQSQFC